MSEIERKDIEEIVLKTVMHMSSQQNNRQSESSTTDEAIERPATEGSLEEILARVTTEAIQRAELAAQSIPREFVQTNAKVDLVTKASDVLPICHVEGDNRPYVKVKANGVIHAI